jgi:DNA-directed RNA polymerase subunit RPC12/RpoP
MTVKVIERGQIPEERPKTCKCLNCHSKLEYIDKDRLYESGDRPGDNGDYYIDCPTCHKKVYLRTRQSVTTHIMDH